jgi:hypothetical protein
MADERVFTLIGQFDDRITSSLNGINDSIAQLKRTMSTMTSKRGGGFSDVTQSVGKLVSSQKHLADSIREVGNAAKGATGELKEYNNRVGKLSSAHYHLAKSSKQAGDKLASSYGKAFDSLEKLDRREKLMATARRRRERMLSASVYAAPRSRSTGSRMAAPRARSVGGGGGGGRGGDVGGSGGLGGYNFHMGAFAFGMQIGQGLSEPITAAVMSGFNLGVGLMAKTMEYIQGSFAERVEDQMTDLQTAGGYLSISKRQKNPMFQSLQSAIIFTQQTNDVLERLAGELPGSTEEYVKVSKRIGDSVMRLVDSDEKGAIEFAKTLKETSDTTAYKDTTLVGPGARQGALQVILGELTKKTVMAGFGGSVGAGGMAGARGLPALMERLITDPSTSLSSLTKYAAVFGDPKIASALERTMPELEKAGSNMLERAKVINTMLDDIVPPEMVSAQKRTMAGVMEAFRSAFFSPGTGFLGFGRKLKDATGKMQPLTDVYGRFIQVSMKNGQIIEKVVDTAEQASQGSLDVFNMFSDIIVNIAEIIKPVVDNLSLLWDPLQMLAEPLRKARIVTIELLQTFRNYTKGIDDIAKTISDEGLKENFLATKSLRASLLTITNLFTEMGVLSEGDFERLRGIIIDPKQGIEQLGTVLQSLTKTFFDSDAAKQVGVFVGKIVTSVLQALSGMTGFASGLGTSKLAEGFMEGFGTEGEAALKKIFTDIYKLLFNAAAAILPKIPWWVYASAAATVLIPAAIAGAGMIIGQGMATLVGRFASFISGKLLGCGPKFLSTMLPNVCGMDPGGGGGGSGGGGGKPKPKRKRGNFFIGSKGEKAASTIRQRTGAAAGAAAAGAKKYLTEPVVQPRRRITPSDWFTKGPVPPVALGTTPAPYTKSQQVQRGAQAIYGAPGKLAKRVGAAPISPVLQAMGGNMKNMFKGGGGRALIRQRNLMGMGARTAAKMGRFVPGGALAFGAMDAGMRMASGEDAGKAIGGAAASTIGATLGGILGQALIPIPGVGAALGTVAGGFLGDKIFSSMSPAANAQQEAARVQEQAARMQMEAAGMSDLTSGYGIKSQYEFGNIKEFTARTQAMGYGQDPLVQKVLQEYGERNVAREALRVADLALRDKEQQLKTTGVTDPAKVDAILAPLRENARIAAGKLKAEQDQLNIAMKALPTKITDAIVTNVSKTSFQRVSDALAEGARQAAYNASIQTRMDAKKPKGKTDASAFGSPGKSFSSLAGAINFENKHKPPGSHLVIANSSETIIPAAKGYTPRNVKMTSAANGYGSYGDTQVVNHINITQQPGQDSKALASLVAYEIWNTMKTVEDGSILT